MSRNLLLTPGPTKVPDNVCEALGRPIIHHRTPQFQSYLKEVFEGLKHVCQTQRDVYLLAGSGSAGMEAAVVNLLSAGDRALAVEGGKFGERWTEICQAYGIEAQKVEVEWGHAVTAEEVKSLLSKDPSIKGVFITLCETSTGVTPDVKAIASAVKATNAVLVVDAVSGLGVTECRTDEWGVDVVVSGSHKGLMLPPGIAFLTMSQKAEDLMSKSTCPKYYFDLKKYKKALAGTDTPFTPAINLVIAMTESLKMFEGEGLQKILTHHARMARAVRSAAQALGLTLFADPSCISNVLTAINVPDGVDGGKIVKIMRDTHGISIAGGQGRLKGKIFRIAHMGCIGEAELITGFTYLEKTLKDLGYTFDDGAGIKALQDYFAANKAGV